MITNSGIQSENAHDEALKMLDEMKNSGEIGENSPIHNEWIKVMIDNPKLIERPIVIKGNKAIIARPPEKVLELL